MSTPKIGRAIRKDLGLLDKEKPVLQGASGKLFGILETKKGKIFYAVDVKDGVIVKIDQQKGPDSPALLKASLLTAVHMDVTKELRNL